MLDDLRAALRRSIAPTTLLVALLVALLETATGFAAALTVLAIDPSLPGIPVLRSLLRDFLLPFVLWLPVASFALAGFFTVLHEPRAGIRRSLHTFVRGGRRHFRRYLTAAVVGTLVSLVILLAVWLLLFVGFLAMSTGFDYYRYAQGARFAANPLYALTIGGALFALAGIVAGSFVAYLGPFVVQTNLPPARIPFASVQFVRRQPRKAAPAAVAATVLFAVPPHLGRTVFEEMRPVAGWLGPPPAEFRAQLLGAIAAGLVVAVLASVVARALAGPLLVEVADRYGRAHTSRRSLSLAAFRPGRRLVAVLLVVLLVGSAAVGVRIVDVHPQNPPESGIDLEQSPNEVYEASVALTERTARRVNYTTIVRHPNGTLDQRTTWRTAWDPADHQLVVALEGQGTDTTGVSTTYFDEGALARHTTGDSFSGWTIDQFDGLARTHEGWIVLPLPAYGMNGVSDQVGKVGRVHTNDSVQLHVSERTDDRLILTASGSDAASLSQYAGSSAYELRNATFRATIDPRTGYLNRMTLRGTLVELNQTGDVVDRSRLDITATYRDVDRTDVERPNMGPHSLLEYVWDALHY